MGFADLNDDERRVIGVCLECVAAGDVILHDAVFHSIMA